MTAQQQGDMRVADYVLGLMEPNERAFFERDMRENPILASQVADWRARVARIDATALPATRHEAMRKRIESGLSGQAAASASRPAGDMMIGPNASLLRPFAVGIAAVLAIGAIVAWFTI